MGKPNVKTRSIKELTQSISEKACYKRNHKSSYQANITDTENNDDSPPIDFSVHFLLPQENNREMETPILGLTDYKLAHGA